jgi:hypothetical protein
MKSAFAKLLEKNPTQSSTVAFRAGGNGVPILTRASASSTSGYQTMGLPGGSMPTPGGGANRTSLGAIRMGDQDGNGPGSAIFPDDIFYPPGQPDRVYPERTFANVGNNVFQPQNDDMATHALLKRLGDQQFKAVANAPFEEYRAQQRLANDLNELSRNASLSDLGTSREIIRNLAAERRQQNEDDFLRKMLDAGSTPEAAKQEIENVRNANAIQEARQVEDRSYQAKMLIQRLAMGRGVTPMVQEPLNQSSSIDNPQRSQAMSQAMGMPGEGFGTSPLDMNRQFLTPEFYKKFLRKTAMSQESMDEQQAFNQRLAEGEIPAPSQGSFSMATLRGQERQLQVENASDALAARLESIRARANRILNPLPANVVGKEVLNELYRIKGEKKPGNRVLFSSESIQDLKPLQLLIAINLLTVSNKDGGRALHQLLKDVDLGTEDQPSKLLTEEMKKIAIAMNGGELNIEIPFVSAIRQPGTKTLYNILYDKKTNASPAVLKEIENAHKQYNQWMAIWEELVQSADKPVGTKLGADGKPLFSDLNDMFFKPYTMDDDPFAPRGIAKPPIPGAPGQPVRGKEKVKKVVQETVDNLTRTVSSQITMDRPGVNQSAAVWKAWAVKNKVPEPHTKVSLLQRFG